jgi:signal transduction histidine kinase
MRNALVARQTKNALLPVDEIFEWACRYAVKHGSPARYIYVDVSWYDRQVLLQVLDHGCGFDPGQVRLSEHGLGFWRRTIEGQLAGEFRVSSEPGQGTVVVARIPVIPARRV